MLIKTSPPTFFSQSKKKCRKFDDFFSFFCWFFFAPIENNRSIIHLHFRCATKTKQKKNGFTALTQHQFKHLFLCVEFHPIYVNEWNLNVATEISRLLFICIIVHYVMKSSLVQVNSINEKLINLPAFITRFPFLKWIFLMKLFIMVSLNLLADNKPALLRSKPAHIKIQSLSIPHYKGINGVGLSILLLYNSIRKSIKLC